MLFNGGVGTYVKSSDESDLDLGDKQNEAVRVDASELKAAIVCEGGNLGFTQRARIEYALGGGKINIDGIDNAAGVNTSDHEVNLKILLNIIAQKGIIEQEEKSAILMSLTEQVTNMVYWNNYHQALALSRDEHLRRTFLDEFILSIEILESEIDAFSRKDFFIPKNENIHEIITKEKMLVRPVLSSLLSYAKIFVKSVLLRTDLIDEAFAQQYLHKYFPKSFVSAYEHEINAHPLRREIIATMIADKVVNLQGTTFITDFKKLGEEKFLTKIKSYLVSNHLFGANDIRYELYRHDYTLDINEQYRMLAEIEHTLNFSTRWMVKYLDEKQIDETHFLDYRQPLFEMLKKINTNKVKTILEGNESFNLFFSILEYMRFAIAVISVKENTHHPFEDVSELFYMVVNEFKILDIITTLDTVDIQTENDRLLRKQILQFVEFIVMHYTRKILEFQRVNESPAEAFTNYIANQQEAFETIKNYIELYMNKEVREMKEINVLVNELMASAI